MCKYECGEGKKSPLCLQVFQIPPQTHSLFILNWGITTQLAPPTAQQAGLDPGLSPCTRKATHPKAPTLHLEGMLIQTKPKGSKITMAVLEQTALCCLWKLKINPKCSNTAEALHVSACFQALARETPQPQHFSSCPDLKKEASSKFFWKVPWPQLQNLRLDGRDKQDVGLIMDTMESCRCEQTASPHGCLLVP